jgi:hypothetical protein
VVSGVTVASGEYPTKMIMTSLTVVPRRGLFYAAKVAAGLLAAGGTAVLAVTATFFAAQLALGRLGARASAPGTLQAALGACLYLTLVCGLAMGIAALTRSPVLSLAIMVPLLFLDSQGLGNVPGLQRVLDYLPDQAGALITHLSGAGAGHFARPYGPWTGMAIMLAWVVAVLIGGEVPFHFRRPDLAVFRCLDDSPRGRWQGKPTAADVLVAVEIVSPGSVSDDLLVKRVRYARRLRAMPDVVNTFRVITASTKNPNQGSRITRTAVMAKRPARASRSAARAPPRPVGWRG